MVFWLTSTVDSRFTIYVGDDKYENERILKYSFPEDVWFHVDSVSSAHVYLRMPIGMALEDVPMAVIEECAALTKDRSIKGRKFPSCKVIYTPASNVKKYPGDAVGTVYCEKDSLVRSVIVKLDETRELAKRLAKLCVHQKDPDLEKAYNDRLRELRLSKEKAAREQKIQAAQRREQERQEAAKRAQEQQKWEDIARQQSELGANTDPFDFM